MRIDFIDIIKGISIIMIVNVHLLSGQFFPIGCTYHVIAFFFVAGIIHGTSEKWKHLPMSSFAKKRFKQLGYPYFVLSLCYILMHMALNIVRGESVINSVITDSLLRTITLRGIGTLWFFPVLYLGDILFYSTKRSNLHSFFLVLIGVLAIIITSILNTLGVFISLDGSTLLALFISNPIRVVLASVIASGIIALGHWLYQLMPAIRYESFYESKNSLIFLFIICAISFLIDYCLIGTYQGDLHKLDIVNAIVYIICSLAGLSFVTSLALIIKKISKHLSCFLGFLGKNSIIVMTTHSEYYINSIANAVVVSVVSMLGITIPTKMMSGIALLLIILIEIVIIHIVNHSFLKYIFYSPKKIDEKVNLIEK